MNIAEKPTMGRKTKGPYFHAVCGHKAKDAYDLRRQVTCKKCIAIRNGLAAQSCAPSQPGATSEEVARLRAELEETKREVQQLKTRLGVGEEVKVESTPPKLPSKPVEKAKATGGYEQALMRPQPKRIEISGDGSIRCGAYVKHDKNIYVLEVEANKMIKEDGFVSDEPKLLRFGYLGFAFDNGAENWLLIAKRDRMEKPYARERPDRSWQLWSDETKDWTDSHPSVCARY